MGWPRALLRLVLTVVASALLITGLAATIAQEAILNSAAPLYQGGVVEARDATTCQVVDHVGCNGLWSCSKEICEYGNRYPRMVIAIATYGDQCKPETSINRVLEVDAYVWALGFVIAAAVVHLFVIGMYGALWYCRCVSSTLAWCFLVLFLLAKVLLLIGFAIGAFGRPQDELYSPPGAYVDWGKVSHTAFLCLFVVEALAAFIEFHRDLFDKNRSSGYM